MAERTYIAIDLKSFYASVECQDRGLDPLDAFLTVADESRTDKTICLAVSPALKSFGLPGRCRLFEVKECMRKVNKEREAKHKIKGNTTSASTFYSDPSLALDIVIAKPRMARYIEYSTRIYQIYLRRISADDIHVYSIDEVFMDATDYLSLYHMSAKELASSLINEVKQETGITATAGIGSNLYLAKVAMDIKAKHVQADENGVRIAELSEMDYRKELWAHRPITDFWRVGKGYEKKLAEHRLFTMGDVARCSIKNEELLYKLFGVNAELLIDHAWGWEPCTMKDIKRYKPEARSLGSGQVLQCPYTFPKAKLVAREMADSLSLELVDKQLTACALQLYVGYDAESLDNMYTGSVKIDHYGRTVPKSTRASFKFPHPTSSSKAFIDAVSSMFDTAVNPSLLVRRLQLTAIDVESEKGWKEQDLFTTFDAENAKNEKERRLQDATLNIKKRFGRNAILRGTSFEEGATGRERNEQIGGHKA
ncbi:MAG: DNA methylase [Spirochaetes bacterium]|uniref:DNA methylase n=1 Tax=Candidatus Ornithospirochaeta stercoripullorum TaxID=2840899 RepID=A0A9D9E076_9SPIO|nr:DNA methylase [Candidatus Ornithospirochaeta stercoripullorum]